MLSVGEPRECSLKGRAQGTRLKAPARKSNRPSTAKERCLHRRTAHLCVCVYVEGGVSHCVCTYVHMYVCLYVCKLSHTHTHTLRATHYCSQRGGGNQPGRNEVAGHQFLEQGVQGLRQAVQRQIHPARFGLDEARQSAEAEHGPQDHLRLDHSACRPALAYHTCIIIIIKGHTHTHTHVVSVSVRCRAQHHS